MLYRNVCNLGILSNEDLDFVKTRTQEAAISSYQDFKFHKGNTVVIVNKRDCFYKLENLLSDTCKCEGKKKIKKILRMMEFWVLLSTTENVLTIFWKNLLCLIGVSEETKRSLEPIGTRLVIMYGLITYHW